MSKNELYELRKKLINSEKYKMIIIDGSDKDIINLDFVHKEHTYLKESILNLYNIKNNQLALETLEQQCGRLMGILIEKNIEHDSLDVLICPSFFMKEFNIINDVDQEYNIHKDSFNKNMLIDNNLVSISFLLSVKKDGNIVDYDKDINNFIDRLSKAKFLVDYNYFARNVALNGYPLEDYSYDMLIDSQINNKSTVIRLDFNKEKTL